MAQSSLNDYLVYEEVIVAHDCEQVWVILQYPLLGDHFCKMAFWLHNLYICCRECGDLLINNKISVLILFLPIIPH